MRKKLLTLFLALCLVAGLALPVSASQLEDYEAQLIQYYRHHQEAAKDVVWDITQKIKDQDPKQGAVWEKLMFDWSWINSEMLVYKQCLPEGLPEDDSLCLIVMGFGLNEDGSIRAELEDRLQVALASAQKYPNAYVLVTGGQTGEAEGVTEAGQMAAWLRNKGLDSSRIIRETQSLSTTANMVNSYKLLNNSYPQVTSVAVITSDYHVKDSCALFAAVSNYQSGYKGGRTLELVGNAVCDTGAGEQGNLNTQAWGISLIFGLPYDENARAPELYYVEPPADPVIPPSEETTPAEEPWPPVQPAQEREEPAQPEPTAGEEKPSYLLPALAIGAVLVILWIFLPKKPKKRNRRQRPKMNWDS